MKKRSFSRILSAILTIIMVFTLVPTVFAEGESAPRISLTEPTPERIFCALNYVRDDFYLTTKEMLVPVFDIDGSPVKYDDLVEEDGTLSLALKQLMLEMYGYYEEEDLEQILEVNDLLYMVSEEIYIMLSMVSEDFARDYPTTLKFYNNFIIAKVFGGEQNPPVSDVMDFVFKGTLFTDEEGYALYAHSTAITDAEGFEVWLTDEIEPNGAYTRPDEYGYKNVYAQLADAKECEMLDAYQAFEILTGYAPDASGNLITSTYVEEYLLTADGNKTKYVEELINEDMTVGGTGIPVREYAESLIRNLMTVDTAGVTATLALAFDEALAAELAAYMPQYTEEEMQEFIDMVYDPENFAGEGEEMDETAISLMVIESFSAYDYRGYIVESSFTGYAVRDGRVLLMDDIMDADGNFLTDEYGCETVWELLDAYMAEIDTSIGKKGDATDDGTVNVSDAAAMLKQIAQWDIEINDDAADANGDGKVNLSDVTMILQYIAGWDVFFEY